MEEARQYSPVMAQRFKGLLFFLVAAELLSLIAILACALLAPRHVTAALNIFGTLLALRSAIVVLGALKRGEIFAAPDPVRRVAEPQKFWIRTTLNLFSIAVGVFLMQLQHVEAVQ